MLNRLSTCFCASMLLASGAAADEALRTPNFVVHAPSREVAALVGKQAEAARKAQALQWLGDEMRPWKVPCELRVKLSPMTAEGLTTVRFDGNKVLTCDMEIRGARERFPSVLAHELTHAVFAHALGKPVPRWADEGAAVMGEDQVSTQQFEAMFEKMLATRGRIIPLHRLFSLKEYPEDKPSFYAEGFSVARFLVERKDRATFLAFVKSADAKGWDEALRKHYGIRRIEELEKTWLAEQRRKAAPPTTTADGGKP